MKKIELRNRIEELEKEKETILRRRKIDLEKMLQTDMLKCKAILEKYGSVEIEIEHKQLPCDLSYSKSAYVIRLKN